MPRSKKTARRPISKERLAGVTVSVQRSKRPGYPATVVMRHGGKRLKEKSCRTLDEAEALAQAWAIEAGNTGAAAAAAISAADKRLFMEAKELLSPYGKTLKDSLEFHLIHLRTTNSSRPVCEVVDALLLHRQKKGKSQRYQQDLKQRLTRFEKAFRDRMIADISEFEIESWLDSLIVGPVTTNNFRRLLHVLWTFAVSKQWARENVISRIEAQNVKAHPPGILSVAEASDLLNAAPPDLIPYLSIALFAGLRDAELMRLDWREVMLSTGYIKITATVSKTGRERLVPICENLRAWLMKMAKIKGLVAQGNTRKLMEETRKLAGITKWPHNATRHSFGTYEMARTKDIGHVSEVMGNSPGVVQRHYKAAIPFEEGSKYFGLFPDTHGAIVSFKISA